MVTIKVPATYVIGLVSGIRCVTVYWLFLVELFVFMGSLAVMVPSVNPLSVQLFVNTGHLSRCNSNVAACALHTDNAV